MFDNIIRIIEEYLENNKDKDLSELQLELDILKNIKATMINMEDNENPIELLSQNPNILFFRDEDADKLSRALVTERLVGELVQLYSN